MLSTPNVKCCIPAKEATAERTNTYPRYGQQPRVGNQKSNGRLYDLAHSSHPSQLGTALAGLHTAHSTMRGRSVPCIPSKHEIKQSTATIPAQTLLRHATHITCTQALNRH